MVDRSGPPPPTTLSSFHHAEMDILGAVRDAVFILEDGLFADCNEETLKVFGRQRATLIGRHPAELSPPFQPDGRPSSEAAREHVDRALAGDAHFFDWRHTRGDGSIFDAEVSLSRVVRDGSTVLLAVVRDVTERNAAARRIRESEARYRSIFDSTSVSLWEEDISELRTLVQRLRDEGIEDVGAYLHAHDDLMQEAVGSIRILNVNDETVRLFGARDKAQLLESMQHTLVPESGAHFCDAVVAIVEGHPSFEREIPQQTLQGRPLTVLLRMRIPAVGNRLMVSITDITQRVRTVDLLRRSEARFREVFERSYDAIAIAKARVDGEGPPQLLAVNPRFEGLFGYPREDLLGGDFDLLRLVSEVDRERVAGYIFSLGVERDAPKHLQIDAVTREGANRHLDVHQETIVWDDRPATLIVARDITEVRTLEEQLQQAQRIEAVGRLAGGVAHDINNLLTAISGDAELSLLSVDEEHPVRARVLDILKTSARAGELVRQLLAFSRRQVLSPKLLDINAILVDMERMLWRLIPENIELVTEASSGLWTVRADPAQLEQVIVNLVVNGRDAMPNGGQLRIEAVNVDVDEVYAVSQPGMAGGRYVRLVVSDTGEGMAPDVQARVFEPFFTTRADRGGTGLGLATVYGIVKQSGGHIMVDSEPGLGTTFSIYLPEVEGKPETISRRASASLPASGQEILLVVEDEVDVRRVAVSALERYGYQVMEAGDGEAGLELCRQLEGPPDLIVTDVIMPRMGGIEFAEKVRELWPGVRVLFISGYSDEAVRGSLLSEPFTSGVGQLQKPFRPTDLAGRVRELLDAD